MSKRSHTTKRYERFEEHTGAGDPEDGILAEISIADWGAVVRRLVPANAPGFAAERRHVEADLTVLDYGESGGVGFYDADMCRVDLGSIDDLIELLQKTKASMQKWAIDADGESSA